MGVAEDRAFFTGSGSGQPKGISQETIRTITPNGASPNIDDIIDLMDQVPQSVLRSRSVAFVGNRNVKRAFRKVKDVNGDYLWRNGGFANNGETSKLPDTLYGVPFYEQNDLPNGQLYFGDWSNYIIGDRQTMSVQTTTEVTKS